MSSNQHPYRRPQPQNQTVNIPDHLLPQIFMDNPEFGGSGNGHHHSQRGPYQSGDGSSQTIPQNNHRLNNDRHHQPPPSLQSPILSYYSDQDSQPSSPQLTQPRTRASKAHRPPPPPPANQQSQPPQIPSQNTRRQSPQPQYRQPPPQHPSASSGPTGFPMHRNGSQPHFQTQPQYYNQGYTQGVPQGVPQNIPQGVPQNIPQGVPQSIPQGVPQNIPGQQASQRGVHPYAGMGGSRSASSHSLNYNKLNGSQESFKNGKPSNDNAPNYSNGNIPQPYINHQPIRKVQVPPLQTGGYDRRIVSSPNVPQSNMNYPDSQSPTIPKSDIRTKSLSSASKYQQQPHNYSGSSHMQPIQQGQTMSSRPPNQSSVQSNQSRSSTGPNTASASSSSSSIHHSFSLSSKSRSFTSLSKLSSLSTKKFNSSASLQGKSFDRNVSSGTISSQKTLNHMPKRPIVYPAMLSRVSRVFRESIFLTINTKDGLEYHDTFTGKMAVDILCRLIRTNDRNLALLLGRALDAQKLFHDVTYNHRLRDSVHEVYAFSHIYRDMELLQEDGVQNSDRNSNGYYIPAEYQITPQQVVQQLPPQDTGGLSSPVDSRHNNNKAVEDLINQEKSNSTSTSINGVFTILTDCYSPTCSRNQLCYSISCPRRLEQQARLNLKPQGGLQRAVSRLSLHEPDETKSLWHETVPSSVLNKLSKDEKLRQELIYEFIYTERDYVKDLEFMTDFYILPLRNPANNIIPEREREAFIRTVFGGVSELLKLAKSMSEALTRRQQQQKPVVEVFADIFLQFVDKFDAFIRYSGNKVFASFEHERQQQVNMRYSSFLEAIEKRPESRKQDLSSFLIKGVQRPARYQLLLGGIIKNTKESAPDYKFLIKAKEEIEKILNKINVQTGESTDRHKIMVLHRLLGRQLLEERFKFKLSYNNRIVYQATLSRKRDNEKIDLYLFEHALLLVKHKIQNKREHYKVFERPMFLPLVYVTTGYDIPTFRTVLAARQNGSIVSDSGSKNKLDTTLANTKLQVNIFGLGSQQVHTTLYADDLTNQNQVLSQICQQQKKLMEKHDIFSLSKYETRKFHGNNKINCAVPCYGGKKLLYGTDSGVWVSTVRTISVTNNEKICSDPIMVISKTYVTQIEVLVEYSKLLILSDKSLYEFDLSCTDSLDLAKNTRSGKLILTHVNSFKSGICDGKLLVCATKTGNTHSINLFEPSNPFDKTKNKNRKYEIREISFSSEPISISFLRTKLCIGCTKGFEILSLEENKKESILDEADPSLDFATQKESVSPLAIHRLGKDFLLSYSEFSFLINRNGWRTKHDWGIFWEGNPNNIALFYPYLISFEPNFVEIRDLDSTRLIRALVGENIRFLHSNEHEALYACEENGYDDIVSIDFLNLKPKT